MTPPASLTGDEGAERPEFTDPPADPLPLLAAWFDEAEQAGVVEPWAVVLATVDDDGAPSARVVLVKEVTARGLLIGTAASPRKAGGLTRVVAATAHWRETMQQVRVVGTVEQQSAAASDALFTARSVPSQAATAAARQSEPLDDEDLLRERARRLTEDAEAAGADVPRPSLWHAYLLVPTEIELWHGRRDRLHRRLRYRHTADGWSSQRLQP